MGCESARYDSDEGRYSCMVSGDGCMYMRPDSKRCAADYGEGPDAPNYSNDFFKNVYYEKNSIYNQIKELVEAEGTFSIQLRNEDEDNDDTRIILYVSNVENNTKKVLFKYFSSMEEKEAIGETYIDITALGWDKNLLQFLLSSKCIMCHKEDNKEEGDN